MLKKLKIFFDNPTNQKSTLQADEKRKHALVAISYFREKEISEDVSLLFKKTTAYNRKMALAIIESDHEPLDKIYALNQLKKILSLCTTFGSDEVKEKFKEALKDNDIEKMVISKENVDNFVTQVVRYKKQKLPNPNPSTIRQSMRSDPILTTTSSGNNLRQA